MSRFLDSWEEAALYAGTALFVLALVSLLVIGVIW